MAGLYPAILAFDAAAVRQVDMRLCGDGDAFDAQQAGPAHLCHQPEKTRNSAFRIAL
jgi:hypothetical protein